MKRLVGSLLLLFFNSVHLSAQDGLEEFLNSWRTEVTWLGIDFSHTRYLGDPGTVDGHEMRRGFNAINNLMLYESDKYDLREAFQKREINFDIGFMLDRNNAIDESKIMSYRTKDTFRFTADSIRQFINSYKLPGNPNGLGLIFICEALDKFNEEGTFYVVCFDMKTKEIFLAEKEVGKAGGFGFRNHWAGCVKDILEQIVKYDFERWQRNFTSDSRR